MGTRVRTLYQTSITGTVHWDWDGSVSHPAGLTGMWAECIDTAPGGGGELTINKFRSEGGFASGKSGWYRYDNFPLDATRVPHWDFVLATRASLGIPSDGALAAKLLAQTNPSRPVVDLPVFIAELKDLPDLVQKQGSKLLRRIAKYNLSYQFAIKPMVNDLIQMLDFVQATEQRRQELEKLGQTGLRRKRTLATGSRPSSGKWNLNSSSGLNLTNVPYQGAYASRVWGSVRWFPTANFPKKSVDLLPLARKAVLGLTFDGASAWELIPFSWLVDWYGSTGDYLMASRNIVPCVHDTPYIMEHSVSEWTYNVVPPQGVTCAPVHTYSSRKTRSKATPSPVTASLPLLDGRQLSILSSLLAGKNRY